MEIINFPDLLEQLDEETTSPFLLAVQRLVDESYSDEEKHHSWLHKLKQLREGFPNNQKPYEACFFDRFELSLADIQLGIRMGASCKSRNFNLYSLYVGPIEYLICVPAKDEEMAARIIDFMTEEIIEAKKAVMST